MTAFESTLDAYPRRYCPICHNVVRSEFRPGPGGRPNASCPKCRSLDRHRFFTILLSILEPVIDELDVLLDVAPSPETSPLLAELGAGLHLKFDLGADNRLVDVLGSLTDIPLRDDCVDLMVCYHVLEHIPDDRAAMREMARVLSPSGIALVQVPFRPGTVTDEDPGAPEEERIRRFGQADHVRYYGDDFEDRMVEAGLAFQRVTPRSLLGDDMCDWLRLGPHQMVWIVRSSAGASVPAPLDESPTSLTRTLDAMLAEMVRVRGELVEHRREARRLGKDVERLQAENAELRDRTPGATVRKIARRAVRRR
jgi:SAM-dependent methyltransferase